MSRAPQQPAPRGMALLGTMVLLFFILGVILLGTLGRVSSVSSSATAALQQIDTQAEAQTARDLAETGVRITYSWMLEQDTINDANLPFAPSEKGTSFYGTPVVNGYNTLTLSQAPTATESPTGRGKNGTIAVRLYPGTDAATGQKFFAIQAIGTCGNARHTSRLVVRPKGFAEYGLFYDEPLDGFVWMTGMHVFSGPVHLNMRLPGTDTVDPNSKHTIVWDTSTPLFTYAGSDYFTCAGAPSQIEWDHGLVSVQTPTASDWPLIATAGTAPQFNVPVIPYPQSTTDLHDAALGSVTAPSTPGLIVPSVSGSTVGGIYVSGTVTNLELDTAGAGDVNQLLTFTQTDGATTWRTVVTIDRLASQTTVARYTTPSGGPESLTATESYSGVTNGLVYVDGDIGDTTTQTHGLSGVVANNTSTTAPSRLTIATPPDRRIQIDGGIVYQRLLKNKSKNSDSDATQADPLCGVFGMITGRMWVVESDKAGGHIDNITIHGALLAMDSSGGTPSVGCTNFSTRTSGIYNHLGALIIKKDGPFGQFYYDAATGALLDQFGFSRHRLYDLRFLELAPVFFPLANRTYKVLSFQSGVTPLP